MYSISRYKIFCRHRMAAQTAVHSTSVSVFVTCRKYYSCYSQFAKNGSCVMLMNAGRTTYTVVQKSGHPSSVLGCPLFWTTLCIRV